MLTLSASRCSSVKGKGCNGGNRARRLSVGGEEDDAERAIGGAPAQLPGGGGKRRPRGRRAHQEHEELDGEAWGGRTARRRCSDGGGQCGEEGDDVGDYGPPSTGWLHRDEEEDEAVRRDTSGELGAAQDGGDLVRHGGGGRSSGAI